MQERIRIPVPDPLGILGDLTKDMPVVLFDPLKNAGEMEQAKAKQESEVREDAGKESYIDTKIDQYTFHLHEALKYAPCPGCRQLVISALVGVEIFKRMEQLGMKREEFTDDEIQRIKREIEQKYSR
uniref:Uncharacterized protein n=1 Tax=viral metagenome TaxID=1070528 RepID=A0A6M3M9G5_9ZZZZ